MASPVTADSTVLASDRRPMRQVAPGQPSITSVPGADPELAAWHARHRLERPLLNPRMLVFRPGALGDTILTVDALTALRSRFADVEIELIGNRQAGAVLRESGIVRAVTSFDSAEVTDLYTVPPRLTPRWATAEVAVLWLPLADPIAGVLREAGIPRIMAAEPPVAQANQHAADYLVETLELLGVSERPPFRPLGFGPVAPWGDEPGDSPVVVVHPGSGAERKNWPPDRYAALVRLLQQAGRPVALLSGPADSASVGRVLAELGTLAIPVLSPSSVLDLARRLVGAGLYIGNDSGVTHLSARLGVPTVAIFGPTDPHQWGPRGPQVTVLSGDPWPSVPEAFQACVPLRPPPQAPAR
jgi:ADP-heptose:LPS heptosyltransferase